MNIDKFYSDVPLEIWKQILDDDMHYHFGIKYKDENPFEVAVKILYKFIKPNSTILDCGCGWGAPAKMLIRDMGCIVDGVTISKQQYDFIKEFPVYHKDLHDFIPSKKYDTALFLESFTHLKDCNVVLNNLNNFVDEIVIKDYVSTETHSIPEWNMNIFSKEFYYNVIENNFNYEIKYYKQYKNAVFPSVFYWFDKIKKIPKNKLVGHAKSLYELCKNCVQFEGSDTEFNGVIIHAVKK
jgi:hypothetical protein